jgi:hypothetical protein
MRKTTLFSYFHYMKYIFPFLVVFMAILGTASAATGGTSSGSTLSGGTLSGGTLSGGTLTGAVVKCPTCGPGGIPTAYNFTKMRIDMLPQCFPWIWASDYFVLNIVDMYKNQEACRSERKVNFGF